MLGVPLPHALALTVALLHLVEAAEAQPLTECDTETLAQGEAEFDTVEVGQWEVVTLLLPQAVPVPLAQVVTESVELAVAHPLLLGQPLSELLDVIVTQAEAHEVGLAVREGEPVEEAHTLGLLLCVPDTLTVLLPVAQALPLAVRQPEDVTEALLLALLHALALALREECKLGDVVSVPLPQALTEPLPLLHLVAPVDAELLTVCEAVTLPQRVPVLDSVDVGERESVGETVPLAVPLPLKL
jgi:hypothetical protein